uniref:Uncharacterized protein n=1 Tax=Setaria digitata TaxID=48799 RepID=A0A915PPJ8_9BILA
MDMLTEGVLITIQKTPWNEYYKEQDATSRKHCSNAWLSTCNSLRAGSNRIVPADDEGRGLLAFSIKCCWLGTGKECMYTALFGEAVWINNWWSTIVTYGKERKCCGEASHENICDEL